jgi:hypothetical protein
MYFLYLDDSGSVQNQNENYFVLGGAIIPEEKHYWINKHRERLAGFITVQRYFSCPDHLTVSSKYLFLPLLPDSRQLYS